jgi:hypothetical protein
VRSGASRRATAAGRSCSGITLRNTHAISHGSRFAVSLAVRFDVDSCRRFARAVLVVPPDVVVRLIESEIDDAPAPDDEADEVLETAFAVACEPAAGLLDASAEPGTHRRGHRVAQQRNGSDGECRERNRDERTDGAFPRANAAAPFKHSPTIDTAQTYTSVQAGFVRGSAPRVDRSGQRSGGVSERT